MRSLLKSSYMYSSQFIGSTRKRSSNSSMRAFSLSSSAFLGYIPITSGVMAAAINISISSVDSSILSTASRSIDAETGSMYRSETLLPKGSTAMRSPILSAIFSLTR